MLSPAVLRVTRPRSEGPWSGVAGSQGPSQAFDDILPSLPPSLRSGCANLYAECTRVSLCTSCTVYKGKLGCLPAAFALSCVYCDPGDFTPDSCLCVESASAGLMLQEPQGAGHVQCWGSARCPSPVSRREVPRRWPRSCTHTRPGFALCTSLHRSGSSEGDGLGRRASPRLTSCVLA